MRREASCLAQALSGRQIHMLRPFGSIVPASCARRMAFGCVLLPFSQTLRPVKQHNIRTVQTEIQVEASDLAQGGDSHHDSAVIGRQ